ncbi:right-handed parallel beta-helix repeat-containing protein [Bacteroidota bacterium]
MKVITVSFQVVLSFWLSLITINFVSAANSVEVSGDITENTVWLYDTVRVTGDLIVKDNITLTINSGTLIEFQGHYTLHVQGTLLAIGLPTEKIMFTIHDTTGFSNHDTTLGGWNSILFNNGDQGLNGAMNDNDTSFLTHCILQYSKNFDSTYLEHTTSGGAIMVRSFSRLVISNSRICHNMSSQFGGGITCSYGADIKIINNEIDSNMAYVWGGGITTIYSKPIIRGNFIHHNIVFSTMEGKSIYDNGGGGIFCWSSEALIEKNTIKYNKAAGGAGIGTINSRGIIRNNIFAYNETLELDTEWWWVGGGGIYTDGSIDVIENNIFSNNIANSGGAIRINGNNPQVINNLLTNNTCRYQGGGIILWNCRPMLLNNTIANNHSWDMAGGIVMYDSKPIFLNNILWGNTQDTGGPGSQIYTIGGISNPDISYSVIQGGMGQIQGNYQGQFYEVLEADPAFVNPSAGTGNGFDGLTADWSLDTSSNCLNRGTPSVDNYNLPTKDIYGSDRIKHGRIDIGASEVHIECISIEGSISKDTILIADTIKVTGDIVVEDDQVLTIVPGTRVEFQGHFGIEVLGTLCVPGTKEYPIVFTSYDTAGFVIDSVTDGGWSGIRFPNYTGNMSDNDTSILEYCTIEFVKTVRDWSTEQQGAIGIHDFTRIRLQHCNILNNNSFFYGGGIYAERSEPLILNCTVSHNTARIGGGICIFDSEARIKNSEISYNSSIQGDGGGLSFIGSKVWIENNLVYRNFTSGGRGAGLLLHSSYGIISNNRIINNRTLVWGGGVCCQNGIAASGFIDFIGNIICNNTANDGGGMMILESDNARLINNTICFNEAEDAGGGLHLGVSGPIFINNLIWENISNTQGQIWFNDDLSFPSFYNCNIQNLGGIIPWDKDPADYILENNIMEEPHFIDPTSGPGSDIEAIHADFSLLPISGSIDAGMADTNGLILPRTDIYFNPRIHNQRVDIGAIENQDGLAVILDQPGNQIACEGDTILMQIQTRDTVNYQWQKNGMDIPDAIHPSLQYDSVTLHDEGNYQCIISNAYGKVKSNQVYLMVRKAPEILTSPTSHWLEPDKPFTLKVNVEGTMPLFYQWNKNGIPITNAIAPECVLSEPDYMDEGTYSCDISNSCGKDSSSPTILFLAPEICMVTVSQTTGHNLVVWEKKSKAPIMAYNIYRESVAAGIYDLLATIPYEDLSVFVDTIADPTVQAYLYKITAIDTAENETDIDLCKPHKTIHLIVTTNPELNTTQLQWDRYYGFDYQTYTIYKSSTGVNFDPVHSMSASLNSWTDPDPSTGDLFYRIAVEKPIPCIPEGDGKKAGTGPYQHTLSNMDDNKLKAGQLPPDTITINSNTIEEEMVPGSVIGKLFTEDRDSLDSHMYKLVPGDGSEDNISFTISGDLLLSSEFFDYETANQYSIRIRSTDEAGNYCEVPFIIYIIPTGHSEIGASRVKAFPNPFYHSTTITFPNQANEQYRLVVTDLSGKVCRIVDDITTSDYVLQKGDLKNGIYFIELRGPKIYRGKIVIE